MHVMNFRYSKITHFKVLWSSEINQSLNRPQFHDPGTLGLGNPRRPDINVFSSWLVRPVGLGLILGDSP